MFVRPLLVALLASAGVAQVYTTDAGIAPPELLHLKERFDWLQRDRGEELRAATTFVMSPTRWLQTDVTLPLVHRRARFESGSGFVSGEVNGIGDVRLDTKWGLLRSDDVMESDRLSLLGDLLLPTGDHDDTQQGVPLPRRVQLGLGCFGAALGIGGTWVRDRDRFAVALRGWTYAAHDGFDPGDELTLDAAWWYRLSPAQFEPGSGEPEWRMTTELLSRWVADDESGGRSQHNGGGELAAALGLQCNVVPALRVEAGLRVPLASEIDNPAGDERFTATFSVRFFF